MASYDPPVYMSDDEDGGNFPNFQELSARYSGFQDDGCNSQEEDIAISVSSIIWCNPSTAASVLSTSSSLWHIHLKRYRIMLCTGYIYIYIH